MPYCGLIGQMVQTRNHGADGLFFEWRISNFPSLASEDDDFYSSPEFRLADEHWYFNMWPNCMRESWNQEIGWVGLRLNRIDGGPSKTFHYSVGIAGSGRVEKERHGEKEFLGYDGSCEWRDFCSRSELMDYRTRLMPHDVLTFTCILRRTSFDGGLVPFLSSIQLCSNRSQSSARNFLFPLFSTNQVAPTNRSQSSAPRGHFPIFPSNQVPPTQDAYTQTEADVFTGVEQSSVKRGGERAHEDFSKLLASGEHSDVTVLVGDVEFKVHRNILSVRSPVFSAMFRHETEEAASNNIKINDCEPDVFREYLQYLYTGSVQSLTDQNVFPLYRIADKYLADDLKQLCSEHILATLSVQTFCEAAKLALMPGGNDLLQRAINFATKNFSLIIISQEWQDFLLEFPMEANDMLIKCFGPRS